MATPKPGEIRCPTCHRSTPPAAFCTQCGTAIPSDARTRPRGLDRDELQERIRARRSGAEPYRRGGDMPGYERFEPQPEDEAARMASPDGPRPDLLGETPPPYSRAAAAAAPVALPRDDGDGAFHGHQPASERPDLTREHDEWIAPTGAPTPYLAPVEDFSEREADIAPRANYSDPEDVEDYDYEEWQEEPRQRRSAGAGAVVILGFLALGVLALLGGAVLAGVFGGDPPVGQVEASPSAPLSTAVATSTPRATPEPSETSAASAEPGESGEPIVFPDGFTAEVQPCLPGSADSQGCDSNGAVNSGALDIWVGFTNGTEDDVISAEVREPGSDVPIGAGTLDLDDIGCAPTCPGGWTYFPFSDLAPGTYEVRVTRNGQPAGESTFVVS